MSVCPLLDLLSATQGVVLMLIVNMDPMARQVLANVMPIT
jgi:hypothetical protein